jgi:hypothetical protein
MGIVLIKVHAGGAWEGHIVYTAMHPLYNDVCITSSSIDEVIQFCKKNTLEMDDVFINLVKKTLVFNSSYGYIVPPEFIDDSFPISSASQFLKTYFKSYYF